METWGERDRSVTEAASWRLASELLRRYPGELFVYIGYTPEGGGYDYLRLFDRAENFHVNLNRVGTIQIGGPRIPEGAWRPTGWQEFLESDVREFVGRIERVLGDYLQPPAVTPPTTPTTLTYRVLAEVSSMWFKSRDRFVIESGEGGWFGVEDGVAPWVRTFDFPEEMLTERAPFGGDPGMRFWGLSREGTFRAVIEESTSEVRVGTAGNGFSLFDHYRATGRDIQRTSVELLSRMLG